MHVSATFMFIARQKVSQNDQRIV